MFLNYNTNKYKNTYMYASLVTPFILKIIKYLLLAYYTLFYTLRIDLYTINGW